MRSFSERRDMAITLRSLSLVEELLTTRHLWRLWRHPKLGRILTMDGELQHVEAWQALYHEPLVHLAAAFVPEVKKALILGGGSLYAAAEVLRYPTLISCQLVDHDPGGIQLMARHYSHARSVLSDLRFEFIEGDALDHVRASSGGYDLIINDGLDLLRTGPTAAASVFHDLASKLSPQGVCSDLVYRHVFEDNDTARTIAALRAHFQHALSLVAIPEYPGVLHVMTFWGAASIDQSLRAPINKAQQQWVAQGGPGLAFYDPAYLSFYLYLPPYLRTLIPL